MSISTKLEDITENRALGTMRSLGSNPDTYQGLLQDLVFELALELHRSYLDVDGDLRTRHITVAAGMVERAAKELQRTADVWPYEN